MKYRVVRWLHVNGFAESFDVALANQLRSHRIEHVLDVGANRGMYVRHLRRLGFKGAITSFEPVLSCFQDLVNQARHASNWQVMNVALGDRSESRDINITQLDVLSSMLQPSAASQELLPGEAGVLGKEKITVRRLSELLPELAPAPDLARTHLKLDTQGYDLKVLLGMEAHLESVNSLQSEVSVLSIYEGQPDYVNTLGFLRDRGFVPSCIYPIQRVSRGRVLEFDALFTR